MRRLRTPPSAGFGRMCALGSSAALPYPLAQRPHAPERRLHASPARGSAAVLVGGLTVAAGAMAARYALQTLERSRGPSAPGDGEGGREGGREGGAGKAAGAAEGGEARAAGASGGEGEGAAAASGGFSFQKSWGAEMLAKRFYRGGFEDKMTRREAALILGVRESATPERIRDRHRKMLMLNHPDMGGSTFLAEKVNEAKDFLLKGGGK